MSYERWERHKPHQVPSRLFAFQEDGLRLKIRKLTPSEFQTLGKRATKVKFQKHQRVDEMDAQLLNELLLREVLLDWEGLTGRLFNKYTDVPLSAIAAECGVSEEQAADAIIPYDPGTAQFLGENCWGLWNFVYECASGMVDEVARETKN